MNSVAIIVFVAIMVTFEGGLASKSRLDIFEINNRKYKIDIIKKLAINSNKPREDTIRMRNVHGQEYECTLPGFVDQPDDEDDTNESVQSAANKKTNHNFTDIAEQIQKVSGMLAKTPVCVFTNLGWWTYEFCFGSHASQYHVLNNGTIEGQMINLGNFTADYNWLNANKTTYPIDTGVLYHEQYYELGTACEINQQPRRVVAKIFCDEQSTNEISLVSEIETCVYEIHINSRSLCGLPGFSQKQNKFDITCQPVLDEFTYQAHIRKMNRNREKKLARELKFNELVRKLSVDAEESIEKVMEDVLDDQEESKMDQDPLAAARASYKRFVKEGKITLHSEEEDKHLTSQTSSTKEIKGKKIYQNSIYYNIKEPSVEEIHKEAADSKPVLKLASNIKEEVDSLTAKDSTEGIDKLEDEDFKGIRNKLTEPQSDLDDLTNWMQKHFNNMEDKLGLDDQVQETLEQIDEGDQVKIKILQLDGVEITDEKDINDIMTSLLKENENLKTFDRLEDNYNYIYDADEEIDEKVNEDLTSDSDVLNLARLFGMSEAQKEEDDPDTLIIF